MLKIAGREKQSFLSIQDIKILPYTHLHIIDRLWTVYSNGHFEFRVKKQIWQSIRDTSKSDLENWCAFSDRVGWRVKFDGSYVNTWVSYKDFSFTLDAPAGHLPSALPGVRYSLLSVLLSVIAWTILGLLLSMFTYSLLTSDISGNSSSYVFSGFVGSSLILFNAIYNGNQQYTKDWWKQLFSRVQACGI